MSQYNTEILHGYKEDIFILSVMLIWHRENVGGDAYTANVVRVRESDSAPWKKYYLNPFPRCSLVAGSASIVIWIWTIPSKRLCAFEMKRMKSPFWSSSFLS